ncbi:MAG: hypothetical protein FWC89_00965 [Defluviitaleaceae bacterium]|nr:hypothetical protein [Defluviitaleaceae bacterium]
MDYSMDAIASKLVMVIAGLSVLVAVIAYALIASVSGDTEMSLLAIILAVNIDNTTNANAIPFFLGIAMAMSVNIAKVFLMKRAVSNAVKREAVAAKLYLQGQYFLRLIITGIVLLVAGLLHPNTVNFMGTFFGILTFPVAMYSMRFFIRDDVKDNHSEILEASKDSSNNSVQDVINELNAIGAVNDDASDDND